MVIAIVISSICKLLKILLRVHRKKLMRNTNINTIVLLFASNVLWKFNFEIKKLGDGISNWPKRNGRNTLINAIIVEKVKK